VWLPTQRIEYAEGPSFDDAAGVQGTLQLNDNGSVVYDAFPVTHDQSKDNAYFDEAVDPAVARPTLHDLVSGNEWRLRRIVGKFFAHGASDELDDPPDFDALVDVAAGFIVCKTDDDGQSNTNFTECNPLAVASMNDPWIWRRRWVLNPFGSSQAIDPFSDNRNLFWRAAYPNSTAGYGSAVDGPHIDQKTARVIHQSERLFCVIAARGWSNIYAGFAAMSLHYLLDYRLLGSLRASAVGNRRNASR